MRTAVHRVIQRAHFTHGQFCDRHVGTMLGGMYRRAARDIAVAAPRGGTVLDAGCGSGHLAVHIARRRTDLHVHGVDLEPGMIAAARRRAERENPADKVEFTVAHRAGLPLPDECADLMAHDPA